MEERGEEREGKRVVNLRIKPVSMGVL